jgi:hypothetical protein
VPPVVEDDVGVTEADKFDDDDVDAELSRVEVGIALDVARDDAELCCEEAETELDSYNEG